ncbi:glycoside hydrolase family 13 protein [Undibacterium amnicola]|uniref:Glycoside hydrolase family 13 protein n=1 Tax=Undibacterium amnicola TaxID=1834038 RepID=A0ABR6XQH9_9BURK|nr:glycoside hydrolase family 13 protein [Undibacterium amnicola]MBC3831722.1 glycoside hydrolase family 13 protein [Undibacterium amnicola]
MAQQTNDQIQRIEPASWWIGMKNPEVQLMVHGKNIAELSPQIQHPSVSIKQVHRSDNPNYLFIDLNITSSTKPGVLVINFLHAQKAMGSIDFHLQTRRTNSAQRAGFSPRDAIYLLMPDRFANGDKGNDNQKNYTDRLARDVPGGRHGGDIQGMRQHLDYIAKLGFTMLWPTPLMENAQAINSYHGYAASDFYRIDPRFGSNVDYQQFVKEAKSKNIGVIQDVVLNHIGSQHWWMQDLPSKDWLNFPLQYTETNHIRSTLQDTHAAQIDKQKFADGWFVKTMPDLNQRNPFLAKYLIQNSLWWIEFADLSGLRTDTYSYSDKDFLARWSQAVMEEYPNLNIVGEEWSMNPNIVAYWQRGKQNHDGYRSFVPSLMDFSVYQALHASLVGGYGKDADMMTMYEAIANDFIYADPDNLTIFEGNHDTPRIFSALNEDIALNRLAFAMLATLRGIPQMFYGAEILMTSPKQRDDGKVRGDFPGGWEGDHVNAFTGKNLSVAQQEMQNFVTRLFNWRKSTTAIHQGKLLHFIPENNCYVYFRIHDKQKIMIIINRNEKSLQLDLTRFNEVLQKPHQAREIISNQNLVLEKMLKVDAKTAMILELH